MNLVIASKGKSKLNKDSSVFNRECEASDVRALCLRQLIHVALEEKNFLVLILIERNALDVVFEAAHLVHAAGAEQFAQCVDKAGAADSFRRHVANYAKADGAVGGNRYFFDGAVQCGHATCDSSSFEGWAGGAGCREHAMLVAEDQLSVRPDIHDRDEALFMRQIDGQQGVR